MNKTLQSLVNGVINADKSKLHDEVYEFIKHCIFELKAPEKTEVDILKPLWDNVKTNGDNWTNANWWCEFDGMREEILPLAIIKYLMEIEHIDMNASKLPKWLVNSFQDRYGFLFENTIED